MNLYELANTFVFRNPTKTDKKTFVMYRFNGKIWVDDAEAEIQRWVVETEGDEYSPHHTQKVVEIVQAMTFVDSLEEPPPTLLCFCNGVLDLERKSEGLKPHSPAYFFRNIINADYDPEAKCPKFLAWLEEVLPDQKERLFVQELFGYCLYRNYSLHKLFFLVGSGRNGKGTLMRTLESVIGSKSMVSVPLDRLSERFQATNLIGKMVNVVSEPKTSTLTTEMIKQLTGQDLLSGEIKGKQKLVEFRNYAKIIVMANKLPPVRDDTLAWWDRVIVLEFPNQFPEEKQKANFESGWVSDPQERSGIVNWSLEGLERVLKTQKFTKSDAMRDVVDQYRKYSQPVKYFVEKYCEVGLNKWVTKEDLYEAYVKVAEEEELEVLDEKKFALEIRKTPRVQVAQKRINDKKVRIWKGIGLKQQSGTGGTSGTSDPILLQNFDLNFYRRIETHVPPVPAVPPSNQDSGKDPHLTAFMDIFHTIPDGLSVTEFWKPILAYALNNHLPESYAKAFIEYLEEEGMIFVDKTRGVVKKSTECKTDNRPHEKGVGEGVEVTVNEGV